MAGNQAADRYVTGTADGSDETGDVVGRFLVRRGLQAVVTVLLSTLVVHVAVTVLPGDPVRALFGFRPPPPAVIAEIRASYNLDEPYVVQYLLFLRDVVTFDLGLSIRGGAVRDMVAERWVSTAWLVGVTLVVQTVVGIAGGVGATVHPRSPWGRGIMLASSVMIAVPVVLSAPVLHQLLTIRLSVAPINPSVGGWHAYILPVLTLTAVTLGTVIVFLRSELRQAIRAPFVHFAEANGIRHHRVIGLHALRPAMPPVVSYLASNLGLMVVGVLIVEATMNLPGLGDLLFDAIRFQDRSVVVAVVMLATIVVILLNLLADLLVGALDPRARVGAMAEDRV